jgi:hypothetical protein
MLKRTNRSGRIEQPRLFAGGRRGRSRSFSATLLLAFALAASSCGGDDDNKTDGQAEDEGKGSYLPWATGNTWTYRVTNNGVVSEKVTTVEAEEEVGGDGPNKSKRAFRVVTRKGMSDETISWQALEGDRVVRYREQSFHASTGKLELEEHWAPHKLHLDGSKEHTADGADWLESYTETKVYASGKPTEESEERDRWFVDSRNETVTVPAGTFDAIVLQKAGGGEVKTYWYVRGVGKVKETGGQIEELVSYEVAK